MGRWAQRRRTGGGPPAGAALITITEAEVTDTTEILVSFSANVNAGDFDPTDFTTQPSNATGTVFGAAGANYINTYFDHDITADTTITYNGTAPGVQSPDVHPIT